MKYIGAPLNVIILKPRNVGLILSPKYYVMGLCAYMQNRLEDKFAMKGIKARLIDVGFSVLPVNPATYIRKNTIVELFTAKRALENANTTINV